MIFTTISTMLEHIKFLSLQSLKQLVLALVISPQEVHLISARMTLITTRMAKWNENMFIPAATSNYAKVTFHLD